ncbi:SDR family oxidoreductase [Streptomyces sp. WAC05374]|uniref:SDR family NAD(P)-dependent oxidoreductase n=1 Tax=Streptomyces sp. WAC05374 TaxID=2487420 RepID=UPI000F87F21B|nr:SDR family oxidoreductase [Streptomyces sp. WAC05374]RST18337.1 SDR family oxidoreductase [Streptomyces sp. WAC05374]TDF39108.1 SDR family oxidoreductase [Streptomyces sp. WAC05374]TDF47469.1 SDR family oxidoreductase [Streptomyces sp. WAC05374]TDF48216.1 SDR family oxidoreductase [Streptomyces sp. WAC05374]
MELHLNGRTALVTGASRGIGLAVVRALTAEGVRVVAAARTPTPELEATGAVTVAVDLSDPAGAERLVGEAMAALGGIDILVNNVGGGDGGLTGGFLEMTDAQWAEVTDLNFFATVRVTRAALPALLARRGAIVNVSSIGARVPHGGPVAYTTAKAALTALGKALAHEFGPRGVRVNTVSPGPVRTAMWESPTGYGAELAASMGVPHADLLAGVPAATGMLIDRLVEPDEVAALVAYLASPLAAATTGADHLIDGGAVKTA